MEGKCGFTLAACYSDLLSSQTYFLQIMDSSTPMKRSRKRTLISRISTTTPKVSTIAARCIVHLIVYVILSAPQVFSRAMTRQTP